MGEITDQLGMVPPHDENVEKAVLGSVLIEKDIIHQIADKIKPDDFYKEENKRLFKICLELYSKNSPIDLLTVKAEAKKEGVLEIIGGAMYLMDLTTRINSGSNIEYHTRILIELSIRRKLIFGIGHVRESVYDLTKDVFEVVAEVDKALNESIESNTSKTYSKIGSEIDGMIDSMYKNKDVDITGVTSGMYDLDKIFGGFQKSDLIIVAARPAMGKTAFCVSIMMNAVQKSNHTVGFFSLEMSKEQLLQRVISFKTEIPLDNIRKTKNLQNYEWDQLQQAKEEIKNLNFFIDDTAGLSVLEFKAKARRMKAVHGVDMIVVDYLQLMTDRTVKGGREQEISSISRNLKLVAKELDIPVIALSQLSRAVESRGGSKRPMLSDLRESGSIEQDADSVMFLYRPEYYGIMEAEDGTPLSGKGEVIIAKNRNGSLDEVYLKFIGRFTKWTNDSHQTEFKEVQAVTVPNF